MGDQLRWYCTPTETHKSRKRYHCDWCYRLIDVGDTYRRYRCYENGDAQTVRMHLECEEGGWYEWASGMEQQKAEQECQLTKEEL